MNSLLYQCALFVGSLALMSISSFVLTVVLERVGATLHLSGGLLGLLTALGADSPEISASATALLAGHHELGMGIVLGSNVFNLAALLGLSATVTGLIRVSDAGVLLNGSVALLVTLIMGLVATGLIAPLPSLLLVILFVGLYTWVTAMLPSSIQHLPIPSSAARFLESALEKRSDEATKEIETNVKRRRRFADFTDWFALVPTVFAIIAGSHGIVRATVSLAAAFAIPHAIAGMLGIAAVTGIPNVVAALRLASRGHGAAVQSECFNSNTVNFVFGMSLPAVLIGLGPISSRTLFAFGWLLAMTVVSLLFLYRGDGLRRGGGLTLILLYVLFVCGMIFWPAIVGR